MAGELDEHLPGEADVLVTVGGEPAEIIGPDDGDAATWPAYPLHLGQAGLPAMARGRGKGRAGDHQVSGTAGDRQVVEEPMDHPGTVTVPGPPELPREDLPQRRRRLDRHHLPRAAEELERQP